MAFTSIGKAFCVLEYARTQSNKTVQRAFERVFHKKITSCSNNLEMGRKSSKRKVVWLEKIDLDDQHLLKPFTNRH